MKGMKHPAHTLYFRLVSLNTKNLWLNRQTFRFDIPGDCIWEFNGTLENILCDRRIDLLWKTAFAEYQAPVTHRNHGWIKHYEETNHTEKKTPKAWGGITDVPSRISQLQERFNLVSMQSSVFETHNKLRQTSFFKCFSLDWTDWTDTQRSKGEKKWAITLKCNSLAKNMSNQIHSARGQRSTSTAPASHWKPGIKESCKEALIQHRPQGQRTSHIFFSYLANNFLTVSNTNH